MSLSIPLIAADFILDAILHGIAVCFWYIGSLLNQLLDLVYSMLEKFSGMDYVSYNGNQSYLISVFFNHSTINKVFWGMAAIGIALAFGFAIWSVVKKFFDSGDKVKASYTDILVATFKAILMILLMSAIIDATINISNVLLQQVTYVFDNADTLGEEDTHYFTDDEYATMFRVLNTIGNYSLNPSRDSRYNINTCFNEIRNDLQKLEKSGVFDFDYSKVKVIDSSNKETVKEMKSWQDSLTKIAKSHSLYTDLNLDQYYGTVSKAIIDCMNEIQKDESFGPLPTRTFTRIYTKTAQDIKPGVIVMLAASMEAAGDPATNSLTDRYRNPFYIGEEDIYDLDDVEEVFSVDFGDWNHIVSIVGAYFLIKEFAAACLNCVARIFNMLLLYVISPLVLSVYPLDDGGKFKQWSISFIVQSFSVFGTIIAIRLMMLFIPIVMSGNLVLFDNTFMNIVAKLVIIIGAGMTVEKASGLITGILSDQAGFASVQAGNIGDAARGAVSAGKALATGALSTAAGHVATVTGLSTAGDKISGGLQSVGNSMREHGGIVGAIAHASSAGKDAKAGKDSKKDASKKNADSKGGKGGNDKGGNNKGGNDKDGNKKVPDKQNAGGNKDSKGGPQQGNNNNNNNQVPGNQAQQGDGKDNKLQGGPQQGGPQQGGPQQGGPQQGGPQQGEGDDNNQVPGNQSQNNDEESQSDRDFHNTFGVHRNEVGGNQNDDDDGNHPVPNRQK